MEMRTLEGEGPGMRRRPRQREAGETGPADAGDARTAGTDSDGLGPLHGAAIRGLNVLVALVGLVLTAPLFLVIAIAVKLDSSGPVFFRQLRVGVDRRGGDPNTACPGANRRTDDLGGRPFVIYKFRTMHVDAEATCGPTWASPDDERTTRVGRFLRRHRLDELPQLGNALKGDMAIVGPRPERPAFFQQLRGEFDEYPRRQSVLPGITGWAQINRETDQSLSDAEKKLRYDLEYLERRSLWFDAYIMLRTPLVMLRRDRLGGAPERRDTPDHAAPWIHDHATSGDGSGRAVVPGARQERLRVPTGSGPAGSGRVSAAGPPLTNRAAGIKRIPGRDPPARPPGGTAASPRPGASPEPPRLRPSWRRRPPRRRRGPWR